MTRLPAPHRISAPDAAAALQALPWEVVGLGPADQVGLITSCARLGITGGGMYDALVGVTCRHHELTLVTSDGRARRAYEMLDVSYVLL